MCNLKDGTRAATAREVICTQECVILLPIATVIFALCASDIATSLQLWVGHPHPNGYSFGAYLLTVWATSKTEHEPQGGEKANAELDV